MSNNSSITAASPAGGTRGSHARANSTQGETLAAGVKRERTTDAAATSPTQSPAASQQSTPAPSYASGPGPEAKKRRSAAPGSRGVANLTPEQLAKKRANGTFKPCPEPGLICAALDISSRAARCSRHFHQSLFIVSIFFVCLSVFFSFFFFFFFFLKTNLVSLYCDKSICP
jgi:hypothetical protein